MKTRWMMVWAWAAMAASLPAGAVGRLMDLTVLDRTTHETLPVYLHEGRYYVAGQPGHLYSVQLRNQSGGRLLGVLSVDGVNALSGDTASWSQEGYVLWGFQSTDILGWRKSLSEVADFVFADASRSYAARTGRPDNVGVIGVAVFLPRMVRPRPPMQPMPGPMPPIAEPITRAQDEATVDMPAKPAAPAPAMPMAQSANAARAAMPAMAESGPLGTGHGDRETSVVTTTDFDRASSAPNEVITLYYDTRARLVAQGVIPSDDRVATRPDPFPQHFVPDPR